MAFAKRCAGCRKMFTPDPRAAKRQVMCGRPCGAPRRRAQAKARRDADVAGYRESERKRQRERRRRCAERAASAPERRVKPPPRAEMSRADFAAQLHAITSVIVQNVDRAAAVSRADFGRQVAKIVKEGVENLGRACA